MLVKGANLVAYPDAATRLAVQRSVAIDTPRGWRIAKEKASHKIDVVVALGMAALGAVQSARRPAADGDQRRYPAARARAAGAAPWRRRARRAACELVVSAAIRLPRLDLGERHEIGCRDARPVPDFGSISYSDYRERKK